MNEEHVREDLAGADFHGRHLIRDSFDGCRMTGLEAGELTAEHVTFRGCRLDLANFRNATLRHCVFDDCVLDGADFGGADLSLSAFRGCSMRDTYIEHARLARVDLRGSKLELSGDLHALKGATIDPAQLIDLAPRLADTVGIDVTPIDVPSSHGDPSPAP